MHFRLVLLDLVHFLAFFIMPRGDDVPLNDRLAIIALSNEGLSQRLSARSLVMVDPPLVGRKKSRERFGDRSQRNAWKSSINRYRDAWKLSLPREEVTQSIEKKI